MVEQLAIVPFGKYKGQPIQEVILKDKAYIDWLLAQEGIKQKYPSFINVVLNYGQEPSETPEHNKIQARFLDETFRLKLCCLLDQKFLLDEARFQNSMSDCINNFKRFKEDIYIDDDIKQLNVLFLKYLGRFENTRILSWCKFEEKGFDVIYSIENRLSTLSIENKNGRYNLNLENKSGTYNFKFRETIGFVNKLVIEIKPTMSDDFPGILRKLKCNIRDYLKGSNNINTFFVLLLGDYTGIGVDIKQLKEIFMSEGIHIVFISEVESSTIYAESAITELCLEYLVDCSYLEKLKDKVKSYDKILSNQAYK